MKYSFQIWLLVGQSSIKFLSQNADRYFSIKSIKLNVTTGFTFKHPTIVVVRAEFAWVHSTIEYIKINLQDKENKTNLWIAENELPNFNLKKKTCMPFMLAR